MNKKYFGTDGIRGRANIHPMTADVSLRVAMAAGATLRAGAGEPHNRVVIGKDTRLSGYMIEQAMSAGFLAMGMDVVLLGPMPTPAVAMLTRSLRADLGVMISASHNPFEDNGIKLFGGDGYKLSDSIEREIEEKIDQPQKTLAAPTDLGRASRLDDAAGRYIEFVKATFPRGMNLSGLRVVIDCAHGAAYRVAPQVLWELHADVIPMGVSPNGLNINLGCGATDTALLQKTVVENEADLGIALDGDADRLIMVDEKGNRVDGDQLMAIIGKSWKQQGMLRNDTVVATVMSNLGLERYLKNMGVTLERAAVGDRYVVEKMRQGKFNVGGEQSGHMVLSDFTTTGDGLIAALQVLAVLRGEGRKMSDLAHTFEPVPQVLESVRFAEGKKPLEDGAVKAAIDKAGRELEKQGRILVRASGTEPVIRVMAEGDDEAKVRQIVSDVCERIRSVA